MSSDFLHMIKRGLASECLHIFRKSGGNLSGPAAAVDEIWSIASLISSLNVTLWSQWLLVLSP